MSTKQETFATLIKQFEYHFDLRTVFDDFLTMTICAFSRNPLTGESYEEALYLTTGGKYKDDELRHLIPRMLASLINEMTERIESDSGQDILGEFYEENLYRKGASQYFTPWPLCTLMAKCAIDTSQEGDLDRPIRIFDPACGSGRMLLASAREAGPDHEYYGTDIDSTCVKMAAINLFLSGMFHSEVMCANFLDPDDFRFSYRISFFPFGIFKIEDKEKSPLWNLSKHSLATKEKVEFKPFNNWSQPATDSHEGSQLKLF